MQCEIKLIRCDNETEIIYGYKVMLVCRFSLVVIVVVVVGFSFVFLVHSSVFKFSVFYRSYPYIRSCIQEDKIIECAKRERKDHASHGYVKQRTEKNN